MIARMPLMTLAAPKSFPNISPGLMGAFSISVSSFNQHVLNLLAHFDAVDVTFGDSDAKTSTILVARIDWTHWSIGPMLAQPTTAGVAS